MRGRPRQTRNKLQSAATQRLHTKNLEICAIIIFCRSFPIQKPEGINNARLLWENNFNFFFFSLFLKILTHLESFQAANPINPFLIFIPCELFGKYILGSVSKSIEIDHEKSFCHTLSSKFIWIVTIWRKNLISNQ